MTRARRNAAARGSSGRAFILLDLGSAEDDEYVGSDAQKRRAGSCEIGTKFTQTSGFLVSCSDDKPAVFSYRMRYAVFYTDDVGPIAGGLFFRSLYVTQNDVHLPVHMILNHLEFYLRGHRPTSNRMMAGLMNVFIEWFILLIGRRIAGYAVGVSAAFLYVFLESHTWAYINVSELPSVLFALAAIYFGLSFQQSDLRADIKRPLWFGILLGLSFMSRFMAIPLIGCIALLPLLDREWAHKVRRNALSVITGMVVPIAAIALFFAVEGKLKNVIYWSIVYNFHGKAHYIQFFSHWIGDFSAVLVRDIWVYLSAGLLIGAIRGFIAWHRREDRVLRALAICWLPAFGGWLGGNPSGIGVLAFHAIPSFPFNCLGLVFGALSLWRFAAGNFRRLGAQAGCYPSLDFRFVAISARNGFADDASRHRPRLYSPAHEILGFDLCDGGKPSLLRSIPSR